MPEQDPFETSFQRASGSVGHKQYEYSHTQGCKEAEYESVSDIAEISRTISFPSKYLSRRSNGISIAAVAVSLLRASESPARIPRVNKVYQSHYVPRYHLGKFSMMMIQGEPNSLPQTCSLRHGHSLLMVETV